LSYRQRCVATPYYLGMCWSNWSSADYSRAILGPADRTRPGLVLPALLGSPGFQRQPGGWGDWTRPVPWLFLRSRLLVWPVAPWARRPTQQLLLALPQRGLRLSPPVPP